MRVMDVVFGKRLATTAESTERIGTLTAIPILGLDALSSAAYGPEAALTILLPLGAAGIGWIGPILAAVIVVMTIVAASYRQTIAAYPGGGGSYTVAKENLGTQFGLLAAAALLLDYILTVAVGISAGIGAIVSAIPVLEPHTLLLCLLVLALLTLVNMRGVREAGVAFIVPTYTFIICMAIVLGVGVAKMIGAGGHPAPVIAPPAAGAALVPLSMWLVVRAFASGCTALTGVEAVSNAVPIFRSPTRRRAQRTLVVIIAILALLLAGIGVLCRAYHIGATPPGQAGYQSVLSQLLAAVGGRGVFYHVAIASIFAILALSANTSFADFPRVCRLLALDLYLPPGLAHAGRRLTYGGGIVLLSLFAGILLVAFGGVTNRLIQLFAIGAFMAFTLSQAGMVQHWRRHAGPHTRHSLVLSAVGAFATGITLLVVLVSKFTEGAWVSVVIIAVAFIAFHRVHRYYVDVGRETEPGGPLPVDDLPNAQPPIVIVPIQRWTSVARKALRLAVKLSPDVRAVQVLGADIGTEDLRGRWSKLVEAPLRRIGIERPHLETVRSPDRRLFASILDYIARVRDEHHDRIIAVIVPEMIERRWYHVLLQTHRASVLKALLDREGGPRVIVISTAWYLKE
jgi:amino acid transporter